MKMKVSTRLGAGFSILVALLALITGAGVSRINALDQNTEVIVNDREVKVGLAQKVENEVNRQSRAIRTALIASEPAVVAGELAKLEDSARLVAAAVEQLEATIHTEQGKAALKNLIGARAAFRAMLIKS
jgi:methyl-accepting chemotaxis protein